MTRERDIGWDEEKDIYFYRKIGSTCDSFKRYLRQLGQYRIYWVKLLQSFEKNRFKRIEDSSIFYQQLENFRGKIIK